MSLAGLAGFAEGFGQAREKKNEQKRYDEWSARQDAGINRLGAAPQGGMGGTYQPATGGSAPASGAGGASGGGGALNVPPELRDGIMATAARLQMDPVDLATIISYETGGTFDPTKRGPTTQWGQHRGLIQFGEPQAQEYGVNWDDPIASQLGEGGAVEKYFIQNGWKPGMGMLDAYSIVNAGAPGRYNASDANNGGAPGNVRDKVEGQMSGHRANAMSLFGPEPTPPVQPAPITTLPLGAVPPYRRTQQ